MSENLQKTFLILSIIAAGLALVASAGGLFLDSLYRDNAFLVAAWKGNDLITLAVGLPLLIISIYLTLRGSRRAKLIWLGMMDFLFYNYAFYLFATAFNAFFLIYVAIFTLSIFALIYGGVSLNPGAIRAQFRERTPVKWIAGYMAFVALGLTAVYLMQISGFLFQGQIPEIILKSEHPTHVVPALDLSLVVPWLGVGAVWLWKRRPWGYIVSAIMLVKGSVYMLVLTAVALSTIQAGEAAFPGEIPLWGILWIGFLVSSFAFFRHMKTTQIES
jgi:hypothetical protein